MTWYEIFICVFLLVACKTKLPEQNVQLKELAESYNISNVENRALLDLDIFDTIFYHSYIDTTKSNDNENHKSTIITRHVKAKKTQHSEIREDVERKSETKTTINKYRQIKTASQLFKIIPCAIIIFFIFFVACKARKR